MNNFKKLPITLSLILIFILLFESCKRDDETTGTQVLLCSASAPRGKCEQEDDICYKGNCINKDTKCGEIEAPCEKKYDICIKDSESQSFKCTEGRCSRNNPDGTCKIENQICTPDGLCEFKCGPLYKEGACASSDTVCLEGVCTIKTSLCGNDAPKGVCKLGKVCSANTETQNFECVNECSKNFPNGACSLDGDKCYFNECHNYIATCSKDNPKGLCGEGKICHEETCKRKCSESVSNGVCFNNQVCSDGKCHFKCSESRPNGICDDPTAKCSDGECKYRCSSTVLEGYCNDDADVCIDGYCKKECSDDNPDGVCLDRGKLCHDGECNYKCSFENIFGACRDSGKACLNGICIEKCSIQYPNGSCPERFICQESQCKEIECSELNLTGPCAEGNKLCLNGICLSECSASQPNGWCSQENFVCHNNTCINSLEQDCSAIFKNGKCNLNDETCVEGKCLKKMCSENYPNGRCENNRVCRDGICQDFTCSDGRPIYSAGEPSIEDGGRSGSCCQINEDCVDGFDSLGNFPTNFCIDDQNPEGPYCLGLQLTPNNDPLLCQYARGCNGCEQDSDCKDPYSEEHGTEEEYFCAMLTYYDFEIPVIGKQDVQLSYCQRVFMNCERQNKLQGEPCDDRCKDSECATGLHCVKGTCTEQCEDNTFCEGSLTCIPISYHLPSTDKNIYIDVCVQECQNDENCDVLTGADYRCSGFTYQKQAAIGEAPSKIISYCYEKNINQGSLGTRCNDDSNCINDLCGEENLCTATCKEDANCGTNAYCHYYALKSGETIYSPNNSEEIDLNYLGECRYLSSVQNTVSSCTGKNDCPTETINGKSYQCLPKFDLKQDIPEGNSGDAVYGRCGILTHSPIVAYSENGDICNNTNQLCESDLCICGDKPCKDNRIGYCRSYCESSSDCNTDQYCKRVLLREEVLYNKTIYGGVCETKDEGVNIEPCNIAQGGFENLCPANKTCVYNAVNSKPDSTNPNKLGVEYICVKEHSTKLPLGSSCVDDFDCNSQLCNKNTNKCSHACTKNSQCEDINGTCDTDNVLIPDDNPNFTVKSGVCNEN